ncbi:MAG: SDR family NAD(P)-dependent oxidoreductase [Gemmatimonadaceae bacterium]|nr:SDR family NAD(P)-dependent oxidoreductase [Gemmatimonadaceae bacterium]
MADIDAGATNATRRFELVDCQLFSRLSGDVNPMHLDAVSARRVVAGRIVVHGALVLLSAIDRVASGDRSKVGSVACEFLNPVCVGDDVLFELDERDTEYRVQATVLGQVCATIRLTKGTAAPIAAAPTAGEGVALMPVLGAPLSRAPEEWEGVSGRVALPVADFEREFPAACAWIGLNSVRTLASASYIVGMICPGLHSIASSYRISIDADAVLASDLCFFVERYDTRFRQIRIVLSGGSDGVLKAFVRPAPSQQASIASLSMVVRADEFAGARSLVVGASRGIGEATAKLLAAGGGEVVLTWANGEADCQRVASEILAAGAQCAVLRFRAGIDDPRRLLRDSGPIQHAYYFATPRIFRKSAGLFDRGRFDEFIDTYASPFVRLCEGLNDQDQASDIRVFHPSSVAISERPRGVTEYAMAKAAVELLTEDLNKSLQRVTILGERLPRIATDQTATVFEVPAASAWEVMLPVVRRMHGAFTGASDRT